MSNVSAKTALLTNAYALILSWPEPSDAPERKRQPNTKRCPICHGPARFEGGCWICDCNRKDAG